MILFYCNDFGFVTSLCGYFHQLLNYVLDGIKVIKAKLSMSVKFSTTKKRKWSGKSTKFGFTVTKGREGNERQQCILWNVISCNANLKHSGLKEHFNHKTWRNQSWPGF